MEDLRLPLKPQALDLLDPPLPLHVDVVGPVDHDLADLGVLEQPLDGPEADDLVGDFVDHLRERPHREDRPRIAQRVVNGRLDREPSLGSAQRFEFRVAEQPSPDEVLDPPRVHGSAAHVTRPSPPASASPDTVSISASALTSRQVLRDLAGSSSPRSWARPTAGSHRSTEAGRTPRIRSASVAVSSERRHRFTTTTNRSGEAVARDPASARRAPYRDRRSSPVTRSTRSASPIAERATGSRERPTCSTTASWSPASRA